MSRDPLPSVESSLLELRELFVEISTSLEKIAGALESRDPLPLRDRFAVEAMKVLVKDALPVIVDGTASKWAVPPSERLGKITYLIADAMVKARGE